MGEKIPVKEGVFTEGPDGGALLANQCKSCGQIFFPKAQFCLSCFGEDMREIVLGRYGKLYSYTVSFLPSTHFEAPYAVGYVDLSEGVRVFAPLKMLKEKPFKIGMEMQVTVEKLWQEGDKEVIGYKFVPI
jgi:uncharacterized OB-fold protein